MKSDLNGKYGFQEVLKEEVNKMGLTLTDEQVKQFEEYKNLSMEEKLGFRYPSITADSGYESAEGYARLKENEQTAYIKPQTYEKWKKRSL